MLCSLHLLSIFLFTIFIVKNITTAIRSKESAVDYRFFPEPDIPILNVTEEEVNEIKFNLPELPNEQLERIMKSYNLDFWDANILTEEPGALKFFETVVKDIDPLLTSKWVLNDLFGLLKNNNLKFSNSPINKGVIFYLSIFLSHTFININMAVIYVWQ